VEQGRCIRADEYEASVESLLDPSSGLWVRDEAPEPCINGDEEEEGDGEEEDEAKETCLCSETDKDDGTCEPFDDYVSEFPADVRDRQEACISGDETLAEESCSCEADDHCVDADDYLDTRPELSVRDNDDNPCISGDQEDDLTECDCSDPDDCVSLDAYLSDANLNLPYPLFVRLGAELCLSGDDSEAQGSCTCSQHAIDSETCVDVYDERVYQSLPGRELWVRDDGDIEPCISGDETLAEESCTCEADDREEEICVAFDDYLAGLPTLELQVRVEGVTEPCISGDQEGAAETCDCSNPDHCIAAEAYPDSDLLPDRELWVRDDGESEACISGDQTVADESCTCEADDREDGTCVSFDDYVLSVRPRNALLVRLDWKLCLSGDAPEAQGDCACTNEEIDDGTCIEASDYRDHFPLDWIRLASGEEEEACISGDDDEADETCLCSSAEKNGVVCESAEDFLERYSASTLQVRPAIEPCFSTRDIEGDDRCRCADVTEGCEEGRAYLDRLLQGEEFTQLPIDTTSEDLSIFDIHSSGLVMIRSVPEPFSVWLQGSSVVSLALLARARRRIRRRPL